MGSRGPIPTSPDHPRRRLPAQRSVAVLSAAPDRRPSAPKGLAAQGRAAWRDAWAEAPWLGAADRQTVAELARLADETAAYRLLVAEHGALLSEPIVTPRGDVVGDRLVPNPAIRAMRDAEKQALALRMALGLTPTARARLGLAVLQAKNEETKLQRMMREARVQR